MKKAVKLTYKDVQSIIITEKEIIIDTYAFGRVRKSLEPWKNLMDVYNELFGYTTLEIREMDDAEILFEIFNMLNPHWRYIGLAENFEKEAERGLLKISEPEKEDFELPTNEFPKSQFMIVKTDELDNAYTYDPEKKKFNMWPNFLSIDDVFNVVFRDELFGYTVEHHITNGGMITIHAKTFFIHHKYNDYGEEYFINEKRRNKWKLYFLL